MRLSRNRNWGHPELVKFLERFATKVPKIGWPGLLVGDMAQARGGPMLTGHASHQVGLDADIWLTPMPNRELTRAEREEMSAIDMVRPDKRDIDPSVWTPQHTALIRAAALEPAIERILVNAAIKKALCREATGDRTWLRKVRPWWGHNYHMHLRIGCPADSPECKSQDPTPETEGCGAELDYWFSDAILNPPPPKEPPKPKPPLTMADLPPACKQIVFRRDQTSVNVRASCHAASPRSSRPTRTISTRAGMCLTSQPPNGAAITPPVTSAMRLGNRRRTKFDKERGGGSDGDKEFRCIDRTNRRSRHMTRSDKRRGRDRPPPASAAGIEKSGGEPDRRHPDRGRVACRRFTHRFE